MDEDPKKHWCLRCGKSYKGRMCCVCAGLFCCRKRAADMSPDDRVNEVLGLAHFLGAIPLDWRKKRLEELVGYEVGVVDTFDFSQLPRVSARCGQTAQITLIGGNKRAVSS